MERSTPYIVRVYNSSDIVNVNNVVIFDTNQLQYAGSGNSYGNAASIQITCPDVNVSYPELLYELQKNPCIIKGLFVFGSWIRAHVQTPFNVVTTPLSHEYNNARGYGKTNVIAPIITPNQPRNEIAYYDAPFKLNDDTRIVIPVSYIHMVAVYYLYPQKNADISRLLKQENDIVAEFEQQDVNPPKILQVIGKNR